jgi:hypothetical protein
MTMDQASLVQQRASERRSFVARHIGGETLIVPVTGNVADLESIFVLNSVASRIWELLGSPTTPGRIAETLSAEFAVSRETAAVDVAEFLDALSERGLIQTAGEGA